MKRFLCFSIAFTTFASLFAGVVIKEKVVESDGSSSVTTTYIEGKRIKTVSRGEFNEETILLMGKGEMISIDHSSKSYMVVTKEDLKKSRAMAEKSMAAHQASMAEHMKNMDPETRKRFEAMQKAQGAPSMEIGKPSKTSFKKLGTKKVSKYLCTRYAVMEDGVKTEEICTVAPGKLGISTNDLKPLQEGMKQFMPEASSELQEMEKFGIPVETITFENGRKDSVQTVISVSKEKLKQSLFSVPKNYKKKASPVMQ